MTEIIYPELSYVVQGALFDVYNELRYLDLSEEGWETALVVALGDKGVDAVRQAEYELRYKGYRIGRFFIDLLVEDRLLLELKVQPSLLPIDQAQVITYLKATGLKLGILVNFGGDRVEYQRIPNFATERIAGHSTDAAVESSSHLQHAELTAELRAALYEVHSELGPGFMHMHYRRATQIELRLREVPHKVQKEVTIHFRGQPIETRKVRIIVVDDRVLLAPLAVREITPALIGRFRLYLQLLDIDLGLIANFSTTSLKIQTVLRN